MRFCQLIFFILLITAHNVAFSLGSENLLPPDQAFKISARALSGDQIEFSWNIADGFSLYRKQMRFTSKTDGIELGAPQFPDGDIKHDKFLGDVVHYRDSLTVPVPIT